MKHLKRFLAILIAILIIGAAASSITCTYVYHLNVKALWWSWILIIFVIDIVFGLYIFYNTKRPDETKTFWLFIIILLPILGGCLFMLFAWKNVSEFSQSDNNHARLLHAIFSAKKSIKIYSDTFYPSYDTFNALNFAIYKGVKIDILLSSQAKHSKQEYLEYKLEQLLDKKVNVYFTNLCAEQSFIIIDDNMAICCPKNFNFKYIYSNDKLIEMQDFSSLKEKYEHDLVRSSLYDYQKAVFPWYKRAKFSIINIFYSFL